MISQKELENYKDAADEIMMLEGDDEDIPYQVKIHLILVFYPECATTFHFKNPASSNSFGH